MTTAHLQTATEHDLRATVYGDDLGTVLRRQPDIWRALPPVYSQDGKGLDAVAQVKLFTPDSFWTWYVSEGTCEIVRRADKRVGETWRDMPLAEYLADPPSGWDLYDVRMFGWCEGLDPELGYVSLRELSQLTGRLGLPVEVDLHWTPVPLREVAS